MEVRVRAIAHYVQAAPAFRESRHLKQLLEGGFWFDSEVLDQETHRDLSYRLRVTHAGLLGKHVNYAKCKRERNVNIGLIAISLRHGVEGLLEEVGGLRCNLIRFCGVEFLFPKGHELRSNVLQFDLLNIDLPPRIAELKVIEIVVIMRAPY